MPKLGAKKSKGSKPKLKDGKLIWLALGAIAVVVFFLVLSLMRMFFQTETYYVLNEDVGPRVQIQPEQLDNRTVREGQAPPNSLGLADVQTGALYTQYPLRAGDVVSESAVGQLSDIRVGVPDNWVITSFGVSADNAVGGRISRGTHFDVIALGEDSEGNSQAVYLFNDMLALDATVSMDGASGADAVETEEAYAGQTEQYVVGVRPGEAAFLHLAISEYGSNNIRLVLSPRENEYQEPDVDAIRGYFTLSDLHEDGADWTPISHHGATDNSFLPAERDEHGRPPHHENFGQPLEDDEVDGIPFDDADDTITGGEGEGMTGSENNGDIAPQPDQNEEMSPEIGQDEGAPSPDEN